MLLKYVFNFHVEWGTRRTRFNVRATSPRCARNSRCWMQNLISLFGRSDYERVGIREGGRGRTIRASRAKDQMWETAKGAALQRR